MRFLLTHIQWDTDGMRVRDLPASLEVEAEDEEDAIDKATAVTGWCIFGCDIETDEDSI